MARTTSYMYTTPRCCKDAVKNALMEIERLGVLDEEEQADRILDHLRDYHAGRIFVAHHGKDKGLELTLKGLLDWVCGRPDTQWAEIQRPQAQENTESHAA